jgi:flagellar protein FliS
MWQNAQDAYLESRILSASPIELVRLLYHGAAGAVRDARRHLAAGNIRERTRSVSKAFDILVELTDSLDQERGGELSRRLEALYLYMQRRLTEANFEQSDGPLAEVEVLLATLSEAWDAIGVEQHSAAAARPWAQPQTEELACCSQGWSL